MTPNSSLQQQLLQVQSLLVAKQPAQALAALNDLEKSEPGAALVWFYKANALRALGRGQESRQSVEQALLLEPFQPAFHTLKAELQLDAGQKSAAEASLNAALAAQPNFLPALSLLGVTRLEQGSNTEAYQLLARAAEQKPSAPNQNNLGVCLINLNRSAEAEKAFVRALAADSTHFMARYNLVRCLIARGRDAEAAQHLQQLLQQQPDHQECLFMVGNICHRNGDFATAAEYLRRAAEKQPVNPPIVNAFAEYCWEQGDTTTAVSLYRVSAETDPANIRAALGRYLSLPMVYDSAAHMAQARDQYLQGLTALGTALPTLAQRPTPQLLREVQWTNFLLAYQGQDDLTPQKEYASIARSLVRRALPGHTESKPRRKTGPPRIGFISDHFYACTAGRYFESWVTGLTAGKYDVHVYNGGNVHDALTKRIQAAAQTMRDIYAMDLERLADLIAEDDLDVLVYPEMGMHPQLFPLGALRLARVQVSGWGHPITTGFPDIDYFLSSEEMEPVNGADHYAEKLHLLPGLGTCYASPTSEGRVADRAEYNLPPAGALYLVPQSLYKIHPDNDSVLVELLKQDPGGTLVMFAPERHRVATNKFINRLQHAMRLAGLTPEGRVRMLPSVAHDQYLAINRMCTVMLDTLHWSGGNTTLDALAVGLPVVTTEGQFMRGRQSAAMLRMIGLPDLIIESPAALAAAAVNLAHDSKRLSDIRARIAQGRGRLFGQTAPLAALDAFLTSVCF
ncbi:MAG: tetratricopeptide repeat protein [Betaproteobacteria bacterium]|nr:tetratricopeptide repeat protein [Betaproteobacteria bacterium]